MVSISNLHSFQWAKSIELDEKSCAVLACMLAFLKKHEIDLRITNEIDIAPIPLKGADIRIVKHLARRLNIVATEISTDEAPLFIGKEIVLVARDSGYAYLLLQEESDSILVALPGVANSLVEVQKNSDVFLGLKSAYILTRADKDLRRTRYFGQGRYFLLPNNDARSQNRDLNFLTRVKNEMSEMRIKYHDPDPLTALTLEALKRAHLSICPTAKQYFGKFRTINLRRSHDFSNWQDIAARTRSILKIARECTISYCIQGCQLIAKIMVDFLTIHPFIDCNRRMAIVVIDKVLLDRKMKLSWSNISKSQLYYYLRCSSRGHHSGLAELLLANLTSIQINDGTREQSR